MFQFENEEYQRFLEQATKSRSRYKERYKQRLIDLQEFLQGLTVQEVDFLLALRKCDYRFRTEVYHALFLWCDNRIQFYRGLACVMQSSHFAEELAHTVCGCEAPRAHRGGNGGDRAAPRT